MECRFCGRPTALVFQGVPICEQCYEDAGSCCLEFGGADLWKRSAEKRECGLVSTGDNEGPDREAVETGVLMSE
jgi:hypothetical protein